MPVMPSIEFTNCVIFRRKTLIFKCENGNQLLNGMVGKPKQFSLRKIFKSELKSRLKPVKRAQKGKVLFIFLNPHC